MLLDTNIAIHLRDGSIDVISRYAQFYAPPAISIVTRVELEGGIVAKPELAERRRIATLAILEDLTVLLFDNDTADTYRTIMSATGYSRPKILDRMIAATAILHGLPLVTMNAADFRDIPGLDVIEWPVPSPKPHPPS